MSVEGKKHGEIEARAVPPVSWKRKLIALNQTPKVSPDTARYLAKIELDKVPFPEFKDAKIGEMKLFYFPDGRPAYYEAPLLKGGKVVGIMFVPALKTMPPTWMQVFKGNELIASNWINSQRKGELLTTGTWFSELQSSESKRRTVQWLTWRAESTKLIRTSHLSLQLSPKKTLGSGTPSPAENQEYRQLG
ncbi:hypothetical protein [Thermococcus gammatolerans]|uniref:Uncharacterized protein n=1 Tax=Thermococcus gammatolerans (strain DSM 15229 / JCM 11827 / EJ3) TaxID=593117 RepID=C5A4D3_THEGJ|nr:hypothetical protein [Thermococcus gammatolerans]ACS33095.1 Hypothetical protein, conserved in N-terminus [Thermococcus gammatolerans EJ3]